MNLLTKGVLTATLLMASAIGVQNLNVTASTQKATSGYQVNPQASADLDVSQGWEILHYNSDTTPNVEDVFIQGVDTSKNQKCVLIQAGNVGDTSFTAQKVIPMKKGHKYDLDLIYSQFYDQRGSGYIDFNGDKIVANNDSKDQEYKKTITPTEDMDYTITVSFTTFYPGDAYLKLGYDKSGEGIIDTPVDFDAPVISPTPEAGSKKISGTAYAGNTIVVTDADGEDIGTAQVADDGTFEVETTRALHYKEELKIIQKNDTQTSPATTVKVGDTMAPNAPVLNTLTDEQEQVTGTSEPYSKVFVTFEGDSEPSTYEGTTDGDGNFTIPLDRTFHGQTKFTAYAVDEAGNKSDNVYAVVQTGDITISVNEILSSDTTVTGYTKPNAQVEVSVANALDSINPIDHIFTGVADATGKYTVDMHGFSYPAGTKVVVTATLNGKSSSKSVIVYPKKVSIDTAKAGDTVIYGEADPNATVNLTIGSESYRFTADAAGNFYGNLDVELVSGDRIVVSQISNGIESEQTIVYID